MGYSYQLVNELVNKKDLFIGKKVLTLGTLYPFMSARERKQLSRYGISTMVSDARFSEHLFVDVLKASSCQALDISDYQGAELICNLNVNIPDELANQFDVILDTGTLEHLSNLSTALSNIFEILRIGGVYYFNVPCNNWVDHGFFQFSPTFILDFTDQNPSIDLIDLSLELNNKRYSYKELNIFFQNALYFNKNRLVLAGVIKKLDVLLSFDLVQAKYRSEYSSSAMENKKRFFKHNIGSFLLWFAKLSIIPLSLKSFLFNNIIKAFKKR